MAVRLSSLAGLMPLASNGNRGGTVIVCSCSYAASRRSHQLVGWFEADEVDVDPIRANEPAQ